MMAGGSTRRSACTSLILRQSAACLGLGGVGEYIGGGDREKREKGERDRSGGINAHGKRRGMVKVGGGGGE